MVFGNPEHCIHDLLQRQSKLIGDHARFFDLGYNQLLVSFRAHLYEVII